MPIYLGVRKSAGLLPLSGLHPLAPRIPRNGTFLFSGRICGDHSLPDPEKPWPHCATRRSPGYSQGARQLVGCWKVGGWWFSFWHDVVFFGVRGPVGCGASRCVVTRAFLLAGPLPPLAAAGLQGHGEEQRVPSGPDKLQVSVFSHSLARPFLGVVPHMRRVNVCPAQVVSGALRRRSRT